MHIDHRPDFSLEAYLMKQGRRGPLCEVRLWLPKQPADDGRIEVRAFETIAREDLSGIGLSLVREDVGFYFEASDIHIRSAETDFGRTVGGTILNIDHIGRLAVRRNLDGGECQEFESAKTIIFRLSQFHYAIRQKIWQVDFNGNRGYDTYTPRCLTTHGSSGEHLEFKLDRSWQWTHHDEGDTVVATSVPTLMFDGSNNPSSAEINVLRECATTTVLLLSLAARRRVVIHGFRAFSEGVTWEEWEYPLSRLRAGHALEDPRDFLINSDSLEKFISSASSQMRSLTGEQTDAVVHAIISLHPTAKHSMESRFLALFAALERVARQFGRADGGMHQIIPALLTAHPPGIVGLWPILGEEGLPGLKDLRNELAHGRNFTRSVPGAISLAEDNLQLWLEYLLTSVLDGRKHVHALNQLARLVKNGNEAMTSLRVQLNEVGVGRRS